MGITIDIATICRHMKSADIKADEVGHQDTVWATPGGFPARLLPCVATAGASAGFHHWSLKTWIVIDRKNDAKLVSSLVGKGH